MSSPRSGPAKQNLQLAVASQNLHVVSSSLAAASAASAASSTPVKDAVLLQQDFARPDGWSHSGKSSHSLEPSARFLSAARVAPAPKNTAPRSIATRRVRSSRVRCFGSGSPARRAVFARVESASEESARRFGEESVAREMCGVNLRSPASSRCLSRDAAGIRVRFPVSTRASVDRTRLARVRCARGVVYASARLAAASRVQHLSPRDARAWIFFGAESTRVSHFPRCTKVND